MTAQNLRDMNLTEEQVWLTIRFLEAYASTAQRELDDLLDDKESGRMRGDQRTLLAEDATISIAAEMASTLRELGQWLLYVDPARARAALRRSGQLFHSMGQAFGTYLIVVTARPGQGPSTDLLHEPLAAMTGGRNRDYPPGTVWDSLRHPQQQAYLMLAISGHATGSRDFPELGQLLETSMHRSGVAPVGALGTPIRRLWDVARHLHNSSPEALTTIARHLSVMCRQYAETMELAQVNAHLWRHAAAPVDVGDIDIAGIAALTARQYGGGELLTALEEAGLRLGRDRIALAPVEAGIALAEPRRDEPRGVDD
jgi:hypothetical protein